MPTEKVWAAREFARAKHAGQKRKHGPDYVFHPLEVAALLAFRYDIEDEAVLCAALLHDVIEECGVTADELAQRFGRRVSDMVAALSREKGRPYKEYAERLSSEPPEVVMIKGADMLSNLRDSVLADEKTLRNVVRHARRHILPLAESVLGGEHLLVCDLRLLLGAVESRFSPL